VRSWQPLVTATDPLEAEIISSEFLDIVRSPDSMGTVEPGRGLVFDVLEFAAGQGSPAAVALARGLAAIATTEEERAKARDVADALVAAGLPDPAWASVIGRPSPGRSWIMSDAYGDASNVAIEFSYGEDRHLLLNLIDFSLLGGWAKDIFVTWDPDETLGMLRSAAADSDGLVTVEEAEPSESAALV